MAQIEVMDYIKTHSVNTLGAVLWHPLAMSRTLMQLGYEPEPPTMRKTFGATLCLSNKSVATFPSVISYIHRLRDRVGWMGVFTVALPARIGSNLVGNIVAQHARQCLEPCEESARVERLRRRKLGEETLAEFALDTGYAAVSRTAGVVVSYPLYVVMVRQMAQVVGGDEVYGSVAGSVAEIWRSEGVLGFFGGLGPRVLAELAGVAVSASLAYLFNKYVFKERVAPETKEMTHVVTGMLAGQLVYRFHVLACVLAVDGAATKLDLAMGFGGTRDAYRYLAERGLFTRGSSFVMRRAPLSAIMAQ